MAKSLVDAIRSGTPLKDLLPDALDGSSMAYGSSIGSSSRHSPSLGGRRWLGGGGGGVGGVGNSGVKNEYAALVERALETLLKVRM